MIYLICAKDIKQQNIVEVNDIETYKTNMFYKYFVNSFIHKNVLYGLTFYDNLIKEILPNRVNVIYASSSITALPNIVNGIVTNNKKDIVKNYKNSVDDIYIFGSSKFIIEEFADVLDYIIVFVSNKLEPTSFPLPDSINFGLFDCMRTETYDDYHLEYYVNNTKKKKA